MAKLDDLLLLEKQGLLPPEMKADLDTLRADGLLDPSFGSLAKAAGSGAAEGLISATAGLPGDMQRLGSAVVKEDPLKGAPAPNMLARFGIEKNFDKRANMPGTEDISAALGTDYIPRNEAERYVKRGTAGAAGMLPFGAGSAAARATIGAASGVGGQAGSHFGVLGDLIGTLIPLLAGGWASTRKPQSVRAAQDAFREVGDEGIDKAAKVAKEASDTLGTPVPLFQGIDRPTIVHGLADTLQRSPQGGRVRAALEKELLVGQDKIDELVKTLVDKQVDKSAQLQVNQAGQGALTRPLQERTKAVADDYAAAHLDTLPKTPNPTPKAVELAQKNNTFKGQAPGAGRTVGFTQDRNTPVENLFSNYAEDAFRTEETARKFRQDVFNRANQNPAQFKLDPVETHSEVFRVNGAYTLQIDAANSGNTRVRLLDSGGKTVAVAGVRKGMIDAIATDESAKGKQLGRALLSELDRKGIANIYEVPDRSPGFVSAQRDVISAKAKGRESTYAVEQTADELAAALRQLRTDMSVQGTSGGTKLATTAAKLEKIIKERGESGVSAMTLDNMARELDGLAEATRNAANPASSKKSSMAVYSAAATKLREAAMESSENLSRGKARYEALTESMVKPVKDSALTDMFRKGHETGDWSEFKRVLDPKTRGPADIEAAATYLRQHDPQAWPIVVKQWLEEALQKTKQIKGGWTSPDVLNDFPATVAGQAGSKQRVMFETALEHAYLSQWMSPGDAARAAESASKLMDSLLVSARSRQGLGQIDTGQFAQAAGENIVSAAGKTANVITPFWKMSNALEQAVQARTYKRLADAMLSPEGAEILKGVANWSRPKESARYLMQTLLGLNAQETVK